ncbi:hypothetical protein Hena1_00350 [Erwinia phage Hena1]|uniref:GmrSD restriction endonucleases N-terminal domain-containing protein n=1 Tax=Erwinia phage Hena1 TaxID=2678601 RepID=A0A6B9J5M3_9CAUD|nr:hypothetical protein HWC84_gp034 [Erwinia phage Hena1]QGZ16211.1 hypothetical protein Hena1_00350 [Erwinia phage Hena1]
MNRITEHERFRVNPGSHTIESYVGWIERGAFDYNAPYQRDYVWKKKQQQEFLNTCISGFPLGTIAIAKHSNWLSRDTPWLEVVDGKQRLMTLQKFILGEIPIILKGMPLWWGKLTRSEQLAFGRPYLPLLTLEDATKEEILDYFIAVNFTGVPQSNKHKAFVLEMKGKNNA